MLSCPTRDDGTASRDCWSLSCFNCWISLTNMSFWFLSLAVSSWKCWSTWTPSSFSADIYSVSHYVHFLHDSHPCGSLRPVPSFSMPSLVFSQPLHLDHVLLDPPPYPLWIQSLSPQHLASQAVQSQASQTAPAAPRLPTPHTAWFELQRSRGIYINHHLGVLVLSGRPNHGDVGVEDHVLSGLSRPRRDCQAAQRMIAAFHGSHGCHLGP